MKRGERNYRSHLGEELLSPLMRMVMDGKHMQSMIVPKIQKLLYNKKMKENLLRTKTITLSRLAFVVLCF